MRAILANDVAQVQDDRGRTWGGNTPGRVFDVPDYMAGLIKGAGGAVCSMAGTTRRGIGYRCPRCRFGSYTRACGRCGQECERE